MDSTSKPAESGASSPGILLADFSAIEEAFEDRPSDNFLCIATGVLVVVVLSMLIQEFL